jgi:hypothetical protein
MILMDLRNRLDVRAPTQAVTILKADEARAPGLDAGPRGDDARKVRVDRQLSAASPASRQQSDGSTTRLG